MKAEKINVLICCEESARVRQAFYKRGFSAVSVDLLPSRIDGMHFQGDALQIIKSRKWDALICFPPCTDLSAAGAPTWKIKQADGRQQKAIDFVMNMANSDCDNIAIENPTGILSSAWRKPDQIINPWQFGEPYKKRTCLWLKGFPLLQPTNIVEPLFHHTSNSTRGGLLKDGTRKKSALPIRKAWDNAMERSVTFQGIADGMAQQWGDYLLKKS